LLGAWAVLVGLGGARRVHRATLTIPFSVLLTVAVVVAQAEDLRQASCDTMAMFKRVADKDLFVSEPPPQWFGNGANEEGDPSWSNANWLKSRFHLNFAEYHGGKNNFGVMRVMNDDLVQPHRGFGIHPHANMEIVTYIVEGELTHKDSMGSGETLSRGAVQFMSAGSGVRHSEHNLGDKPLRFIQMWFHPAERGLEPNYGSFAGDAEARRDKLHHLVSDVRGDIKTPVQVHQDLNIWTCELSKGESIDFKLNPGRQGYLLSVEGSLECSGEHGSGTLLRHDAAELHGTNVLKIVGGDNGSHFLLLEMEAA